MLAVRSCRRLATEALRVDELTVRTTTTVAPATHRSANGTAVNAKPRGLGMSASHGVPLRHAVGACQLTHRRAGAPLHVQRDPCEVRLVERDLDPRLVRTAVAIQVQVPVERGVV